LVVVVVVANSDEKIKRYLFSFFSYCTHYYVHYYCNVYVVFYLVIILVFFKQDHHIKVVVDGIGRRMNPMFVCYFIFIIITVLFINK
jgi:hypothetical protein